MWKIVWTIHSRKNRSFRKENYVFSLVSVAFEVPAGYLYKYQEKSEMISELSAHGTGMSIQSNGS